MQCKVFLLFNLAIVSAGITHAQARKGYTHADKTDSVTYVLPAGSVPQSRLLALNTAPAMDVTKMSVSASTKSVSTTTKGAYKPVPLAGQKSYFGEKNDYVIDFVRQYLLLHNQTLNCVQGKSATPFSLIDNVLEKNNIPKELKYLAVIESALNHNAISNAGAVGPWQLMESTARMMGLSVSKRRDDRTDWYKSTSAAAKYLSILYSQFDDWLLVIAAYNSGPVPVQRAIERTGSHNFWAIKQYLPRETQGHVLAFISTASIFEHLSKFIGLGSIPVDFKFSNEETKTVAATSKDTHVAALPVFTEEEKKNMTIVRIMEPLSLDVMAQDLGMDRKLLSRWNPDYDLFVYNTYPTPYYNLRLPKDQLDHFLERKDFINKKSKQYYNEVSVK